jgi:signal transduction histidine kinase
MPALVFPRLVPHGKGANAGAGPFSRPEPKIKRAPAPKHAPGNLVGPESSSASDDIDRLAHDARNILSGLTLCCELLAAPGVLTKPHAHYAQDLESIAGSVAQILEKIIGCAASAKTAAEPAIPASAPVTDVAAELRHLQPLLAAIAGPAIRLTIATLPCPGHTALALEGLTRILVNLVGNAADAMSAGGHVHITAQYADGPGCLDSGYAIAPHSIVLTVADDGPGIPEALREQIFDPGFTTRSSPEQKSSPEQTSSPERKSSPEQTTSWPAPRRRGLGLSIVRSLVEATGGTIRALSRQPRGARFEITLPLCAITSGTCVMPPGTAFPADSRAKGCIECQ